MGLDIYCFIGSPPSRSTVMFVKLNQIEYNEKQVDILKGEQNTPEYLALNPRHTVPVMDEDGFVIWESAAIVKYLAGKYQTSDHWYPSDPQQRAKVDEVLEWRHHNIRKCVSGVFYNIKLKPIFGMPAITPEEAVGKYRDLDDSLITLEHQFLKDQQFLCGDEISIADLFIANEVFQATLCEKDIFENHPKFRAWMDRVREGLNPVWDEIVDKWKQRISA
ncbi:glutathione S-transferase theta-3-like [Amphiura filiformis]|uniref:glutathione S-transferase theta-3-like n=1 Tax=Amphiura filiformis TaxID=82378 RepID=UPI003B219028